MHPKRWQDWVNLSLGAWLFVSPWVLGFDMEAKAAWNSYLLGAAIVIFAAVAVYLPQVWEEAINVLLGIWVVVSPWVLDFSAQMAATTNALVVGVLVTLFALWAMQMDTDFQKWWHGGQHPA